MINQDYMNSIENPYSTRGRAKETIGDMCDQARAMALHARTFDADTRLCDAIVKLARAIEILRDELG